MSSLPMGVGGGERYLATAFYTAHHPARHTIFRNQQAYNLPKSLLASAIPNLYTPTIILPPEIPHVPFRLL